MNRLPGWVRQHIAGLRALLIFTVLCGIIYPVVMWGVAQVAFHHQANGSLVSYHGRVVGSSLLCQESVDATVKTDYGCNPLFSAASNLGPTNPDLVKLIKERQQQIAKLDHVKVSQIPPDAVTASGSGLDPGISPQNAAIQVDRVAAARNASPAAVMALVKQYTQGSTLGLLGETMVNVLLLNVAVDKKFPVGH